MKLIEVIDAALSYNENLLRIKKGELYFARDDIPEEKKEKTEGIFIDLCTKNDKIAYELKKIIDIDFDQLEWGIKLPSSLIRDMVEVELMKLKKAVEKNC